MPIHYQLYMVSKVFTVDFPLCMMYVASDYSWNLHLEKLVRTNKRKFFLYYSCFLRRAFRVSYPNTIFVNIQEMLYSFGETSRFLEREILLEMLRAAETMHF